jgi:hypothetical protein
MILGPTDRRPSVGHLQFIGRCDPPPMIAEPFAIGAFVAHAVHFPGLAELATRAPPTGAPTLVIHSSIP